MAQGSAALIKKARGDINLNPPSKINLTEPQKDCKDMSIDKTGGPAYPRAAERYMNTAQEGMTLRDYFAGQALAGDMVNGFEGNFDGDDIIKRTKFLYRMADAMIEARDAQ